MYFDTGLKGIKERVIQDGIYAIVLDYDSDEVLSIDNKPESQVFFTKKTKEAQQFFFFKFNNEKDCYTIMSLNSHFYLGVEKRGDSNYNDSHIKQNMNELKTYIIYWDISFDDGYSFQLNGYDYNLHYIDDNKSAILKQKDNSMKQKFYIKTVDVFCSGLYYIYSLSPNKYYISFSADLEKKSYLNWKSRSDDQLFYIIFDPNDGCYSIINYNNLKCLSSELKQTEYYNLDNQKWIFRANDFKSYIITLKSDNSILCNSVSKKNDRDLCLKSFQNIYAYNCEFQIEPYDNSLLTKLHNYIFKNENNKDPKIAEIEYRMNFRHSVQISDFSTLTKEIINSQLFFNSFNLKYLEISTDINNINKNAFLNCVNIKFIKCHPKWLHLLPNKINVENIVIQEGTESIPEGTFNEFNNLKYLSLPSSLNFESCNKNLFRNIYGLKKFKGNPLFLSIIQKEALTMIIIPSYVKVIPEGICANCKSLREVYIDENDSLLKEIEPKAFAGCELLSFVSIPQSVTNIAPNSFKGCNKYFVLKLKNEEQENSMLKNLIIDLNITEITMEYKKYKNITRIEIPTTVKEIEQGILNKFKMLKKVKCDPKWLNFFNKESVKVVSIPDKVTELKKSDFENLLHLKFIEIPESVTKIEEDTFQKCEKLFNIKCGRKHLQFLNKKQIKSICLNEQVKTIEKSDFDGFENLETCKINENTKINDPKTFSKCKKLMNIDYPNGKSLINNSVFISENKKVIEKEDFEGWTNLMTLVIPNSIKEIKKDAFKDCINLENLTCDPKWFSHIPKNSIKKIIIPTFVKELNKGQFDGFTSLTYIRLPQEIIIKDKTIFDSCEKLKKIRCKSLIFSQLSEKTQERCESKLKTKYQDPIFNIQPDESKVYDETGLIKPEVNFESSFYASFSSIKNEYKSMNIDRLVAFDASNVNRYKDGINKVLRCIQSNEIEIENDSEDTDIFEISKICGKICNEISKKLNIKPNVVQIYAILRFADEILNKPESKGAIGEIKPGEGESLIIAILSIILIKYNRTIDIITSNLKYAKRYQNEQSPIFDLFNIKSAILVEKDNDSNSDLFDEYIHDFNLEAFDCPVVYSTNQIFEYYYLNILFSTKSRKREFDVVLTGDLDNILFDELYSPKNISKKINYVSLAEILCIVFATRLRKVSMIRDTLKQYFQGASEFDEDDIILLKNAAIEAFNKKKDVDYIVKDNQIIIIDNTTGCKMPYSHWPIYLLQMVEIKESIPLRPIALSMCQITYQIYIKLYKKIVGITGAFGNESNEDILKKNFEVNTFKVPPNLPSEVEIYYKNRPETIEDVFNLVNIEINNELEQNKRPVLVIWDSKYNAEKFLEFITRQKVGVIFGVDQKSDEKAIKSAGKKESLTITTSFAIQNIDIIISKDALKVGGLHVVIPMKIPNIKSLEKHVSMAGRNGQTGSVTLFITQKDLSIKTLSFNRENINLDKLQNYFAKYIKENFNWMLCGQNKNDFGNSVLPFAANYSDIFNILSSQLYLILKEITTSNEIDIFQDLSWLIVQSAWTSFFTGVKNDKSNNCNWNNCERKYNRFITSMNEFFSISESKTVNSALNFLLKKFNCEKNNEYIIYKSFKISDLDINLISAEDEFLDSYENQEKNHYIKSIINKVKSNIIWMKEKYDDNLTRIPCKSIFRNIPQIEINIFEIDFIKMTAKLAKEAYDGHFSIGRVIFASETNDICKPKFYCIEYLNMLFVVTRGTNSDKDLMTDLLCEEICQNINGVNIYFHKGFLAAAYIILNDIHDILERNYEKIIFVGHSYAAAVSNILCLLTKIDQNYKDKNIYSLAFAPPPSMSKIPADIQDCMFLFINRYDIIPRLSLNNIKETMCMKNGISLKYFIETKLVYLKMIGKTSGYAQMLAEFIEKNKLLIYSVLDSVKNDFHVKKNIGNIFNIGLSRSIKLRNYLVDETNVGDDLYFIPDMIFDHSIEKYISSFDIIKEY